MPQVPQASWGYVPTSPRTQRSESSYRGSPVPYHSLPMAPVQGPSMGVITRPSDPYLTPPRTYPKHTRFYFEDGTTTFQAGGTLFKVHRHFFQQYSQSFAEKYMRHNGGSKPSQADDDESPIVLEDISALDFERFLSVFYPKSFDSWELTETEQLVSVLRLARRWEFQSIVGLVARRLTEVASLVDQVALAIEHNLPTLVGPAGAKLCARAEPLTLAESRRLGIDAAYAIWTLRERFRGGRQTVPVSDMAREEKRVQSFFEEAGLIRSSIEGLTRRRSDSSDSGITLSRQPRRRSPSPPYFPRHP